MTDVDVDNDGDPEDPTVSTLSGFVDLAITKEIDIESPEVEDIVTFTITLSNTGTISATNINITEQLPTGYTYISHTTSVGVFANDIWLVPSIDPNGIETLLITAEVLGTGDYDNTATITSFDGSTDGDLTNSSSTVTVATKCFIVYNEISPNSDGENDWLKISCIERFPNNTLEIFNRWGNTVFKTTGYDNSEIKGFKGTSSGRVTIQKTEELPVGTYYYVLDLGNGSEPRVGWLYINR